MNSRKSMSKWSILSTSVGTYLRIQTTTNGEDCWTLPRIAEVDDHVTRKCSLIGWFDFPANSAEGDIHTILTTLILPSRTPHHGIMLNQVARDEYVCACCDDIAASVYTSSTCHSLLLFYLHYSIHFKLEDPFYFEDLYKTVNWYCSWGKCILDLNILFSYL